MSEHRLIHVEKKSAKELAGSVIELMATVFRLRSEVKNCRNELCLKCGMYKEAHKGACDDCRYRKGGEWERDIG